MEQPIVGDPRLVEEDHSHVVQLPSSATPAKSEEDHDPCSAALPPVKVDYKGVFPEAKARFAPSAFVLLNEAIEMIYTLTSKVLYNVLILIIGIVASLAWAIVFTLTTFFNNWIISPSMRLGYICLYPYMGLHRAMYLLFLEPCFSAIAFALNQIKASSFLKPYNPALPTRSVTRSAGRASSSMYGTITQA
eukprot:m.311527 g.311527  ORF g.311527 m.311527 type:complete len:191 (+) comp76384_c0_seq1:8-580(+)